MDIAWKLDKVMKRDIKNRDISKTNTTRNEMESRWLFLKYKNGFISKYLQKGKIGLIHKSKPPWLNGYVVRYVVLRYCVQTSTPSVME
jgi:hypothetical protein